MHCKTGAFLIQRTSPRLPVLAQQFALCRHAGSLSSVVGLSLQQVYQAEKGQ